jgi:hypothetical protein
MSCLFYVLYMYFYCNEKRGMIGKYYVDKPLCSVNVSCNILPWIVKHEETSCISYDSTNRTLKVHSPGSYQIHLSLTLMSHIGLRDKLILACIHTNKEEKCGRYEGRATQINIAFTVKLVDPSQTFWVAFQEWESNHVFYYVYHDVNICAKCTATAWLCCLLFIAWIIFVFLRIFCKNLIIRPTSKKLCIFASISVFCFNSSSWRHMSGCYSKFNTTIRWHFQ